MSEKTRSKRLSFLVIVAAIIVIAAIIGGCSPNRSQEGRTDKTSEQSSESPAAAIDMTQWNSESDCTTCHTVEGGSMENSACVGSRHSDMACIACHVDNGELTEIHQAAKNSKPGKIKRLESPIKNEFCFTCHGSYESLAELTVGVTVLTDKSGTTINPHAIPTNAEHDTDPACKDCHAMHGDSDPQAYCRSCHHADVYECGTCHE